MALRYRLRGGVDSPQEKTVVGDIVVSESEKIVVMSGGSGGSGLLIQRESLYQLATLSRHVSQLEQVSTEIAEASGFAVNGYRLLQVVHRSSKISTLHGVGSPQEPIASSGRN